MLKSSLIILSIFIKFIVAQQNILDDRYTNRISQQSVYYGNGYGINIPNNNLNLNNNNNNNNVKDGLIEEFGQCGGLEWEGPRTCQLNLVCFKRSKYYSQCLSKDAAEAASNPAPQATPPGGKCHGGSIHGSLPCAIGTACFIQTENVHGECKTHCPPGWFCARQTLPEWAPCGGESYVGLTKCKEGLYCFPHSKWYHECRSECPPGWKC